MFDSDEDILNFIKTIRSLDSNINVLLTNGGCYKFAKFLKSKIPGSSLYIINEELRVHVIVKYKNSFFDINGYVLNVSKAELLTEEIITKLDAENWDSSFNLNIELKSLKSKYEAIQLDFPEELEKTINKNNQKQRKNRKSFIDYLNILFETFSYSLKKFLSIILCLLFSFLISSFLINNFSIIKSTMNNLFFIGLILFFILILIDQSISNFIYYKNKNKVAKKVLGKAYLEPGIINLNIKNKKNEKQGG